MRGDPEVEKISARIGLLNGRMVGPSKSGYHRVYPDHLVLFNGSISDASGRLLWWGDLDVTVDEEKLVALARTLDRRLYLFFEADTHFVDVLPIERAAVIVEPSGEVTLGEAARGWLASSLERAREAEEAGDDRLFGRDTVPERDAGVGRDGELVALRPEGIAVLAGDVEAFHRIGWGLGGTQSFGDLGTDEMAEVKDAAEGGSDER